MRDIVMVVGSGMMGSGIGAMSALAGNKTVLVDTSAERAENGRKKAIECIRLREENELNTHEEAEKAIELLSTTDDSIKTAENARLVIEAIIENVEAKQNLFAQLDAVLPVEVPICSNTSGLRITDISAKCVHPERTVTTHFWLPAHLVPLVEVVMGDKTDEAVAVAVRDELRKWKKAPVLVKRDLPGQLANVYSRPSSVSLSISCLRPCQRRGCGHRHQLRHGNAFPGLGPAEASGRHRSEPGSLRAGDRAAQHLRRQDRQPLHQGTGGEGRPGCQDRQGLL